MKKIHALDLHHQPHCDLSVLRRSTSEPRIDQLPERRSCWPSLATHARSISTQMASQAFLYFLNTK